ncbi:hypothetical protein, partial [Acinetobacter baumannii]|uniref:hypothetical protein n=1 Tax=Acinetobacter baumannii TaxID=470 RepID=UPI001C077486
MLRPKEASFSAFYSRKGVGFSGFQFLVQERGGFFHVFSSAGPEKGWYLQVFFFFGKSIFYGGGSVN